MFPILQQASNDRAYFIAFVINSSERQAESRERCKSRGALPTPASNGAVPWEKKVDPTFCLSVVPCQLMRKYTTLEILYILERFETYLQDLIF